MAVATGLVKSRVDQLSREAAERDYAAGMYVRGAQRLLHCASR